MLGLLKRRDLQDRHPMLKVLGVVGALVPSDRLRTMLYLNGVKAPRQFLRRMTHTFYRMDHVYDVCKQFGRQYEGSFSMLEFGVADGYSFTKKLYATRYLGMEHRITVHGFDTFEGLPEYSGEVERSLVSGVGWTPGHYRGRYDDLKRYCESRYSNFVLHRGLFSELITDDFLNQLIDRPPILIWIDCDYYSSTRDVFDRLTPYIPTGCVTYFDDIDYNFGSRLTGEMRAVWEINNGQFGDGIELVPDRELSWGSRRIYRFINANAEGRLTPRKPVTGDPVRYRRGDDSPFP